MQRDEGVECATVMAWYMHVFAFQKGSDPSASKKLDDLLSRLAKSRMRLDRQAMHSTQGRDYAAEHLPSLLVSVAVKALKEAFPESAPEIDSEEFRKRAHGAAKRILGNARIDRKDDSQPQHSALTAVKPVRERFDVRATTPLMQRRLREASDFGSERNLSPCHVRRAIPRAGSSLGGVESYTSLERRTGEQQRIFGAWEERKMDFARQLKHERRALASSLAQLDQEKASLARSASPTEVSKYVATILDDE